MERKVISDNEWVEVVQADFPGVSDNYIYIKALKETAACIVIDANTGKYLMRVEGTLANNFTPAPKIMTETLEEGESAFQACIRGIKEEFGEDVGEHQVAHIGTINGTFQELHNYYIYFCVLPYSASYFEGDGSEGENKSMNILMDAHEMPTIKDFLTMTAYGFLKATADSDQQKILDVFQSAGMYDVINANQMV